jgi:FtsH-binding integral membrane protein
MPSRSPSPSASPSRARRPVWPWYLLLLPPFVGMLWVPFYNQVEPRAAGVPFFYWYQFVWIGISVVLTAIVYFGTRDAER